MTKLLLLLGFASAMVVSAQPGPPRASWGIGTTLPVVCSVGQAFYKSNATAGSNWYMCTSTNTWTVQGGTSAPGGNLGGSSNFAPGTGGIGFGSGTNGQLTADATHFLYSSTVSPPPSAPVITTSGVAGAATWAYKVVGTVFDGPVVGGLGTAASAAGQTTTGNATLTISNFTIITPPTCSIRENGFDIWRTTSGGTPATTGLIGHVSCGGALNDTGLALLSPVLTTPPSADYSQGLGVGFPVVIPSNLSVGFLAAANNSTNSAYFGSPGYLQVLGATSDPNYPGTAMLVDTIADTDDNRSVDSQFVTELFHSMTGRGKLTAEFDFNDNGFGSSGSQFENVLISSTLSGTHTTQAQPFGNLEFTLNAGGASFVEGAYMLAFSPVSISGLTNFSAIRIQDITGATNNWAIRTGLGKVEFGDVIQADNLSASLPVCTDASKNLSSTCTGLFAPIPLRAISGTISGALTIGTCNTATVSVTGARNTMTVDVTPTTNPDSGSAGLVRWDGFVSANDVVTVRECGLGVVTPTSTTYQVAVIR